MSIITNQDFRENARLVARRLHRRIEAGRTIYVAGNGGSFSQASHLHSEMVGVLSHDHFRPAYPCILLGASQSLVSAYSNDFGYDLALAREASALVESDDLVCLFTTSRQSDNLTKLAETVRKEGATPCWVGGTDRANVREGDIVINIDGDTQAVQEKTLILIHMVVEELERLFGHREDSDYDKPTET